jgi:hypothetical protein
VAIARRMGERGGRHFIRRGIWPRCPFRGEHPVVRALALEWFSAVTSITGPYVTASRRINP